MSLAQALNHVQTVPGTDFLDEDGREETHWAYAQVLVYLFFSIMPGFSFGSIYGVLIQEYGMTPAEISQTSSWYLLVLALAGFVLLPVANYFGRKRLLLIGNIVNIAGLILLALSKTRTSFLWARIVSGIGSTPVEWIGLAVVGDCYFTYEAGAAHAVGFAPFIVASLIGSPIVGAFDQYGVGWRNFFWMCTAFLGAIQIMMLLFLPETLWPRGSEADGVLEQRPAAATLSKNPMSEPSRASVASTDYKEAISPAVTVPGDVQHIIDRIGQGAPSASQRAWLLFPINRAYSPWQHAKDTFVLSSFGPILLFSFGWAAIGGSATAMGYLSVPVWAAPPYNFGSAAVGCTNIPLILGTLFGFVLAGPIVDADVARQARANRNVREPEMRLRVVVIASVFIVLGLLIFAIGLEHKWHWAAILIPGIGLNAFAISFAVAGISSYATDTYKMFALEIGFITTIWKNLWTFGLGYFINDLYEDVGPLRLVAVVSIPLFIFIVLCVLFLFIGKPLRALSGRATIMKRD